MNRLRSLSLALPSFCFASAMLAAGCAAPSDSGGSSASGNPGGIGTATVSGTASWRERMSLPPGASFEATLEDVSRADARSEVIGRTRIETPGAPPIRFSIPYDPSRVQARNRHVVRARVMHEGRLLFTTDTAYPVSLPAGQPVELRLVRAGAGAAASAQRLRGRYTYMADAGSFVDCRSGQRLMVATEGDNAALESAYLKTRPAPGIPVLATVDGRVESRVFTEGPARPMLVVERFVAVQAGHGCSGPLAQAPLENTYWKLLNVRGSPVTVDGQQAEPHLILRPRDKRVAGSGGCNRIIGGYSVDGDRLSLSQLAGTMMMCAHGMEQERAILDMLGAVRRWRIFGDRLDLLDDSGEVVLAQLESRHMR